MKKLLSFLGAVSIIASSSSYAVACGDKASESENTPNTNSPDLSKSESVALSQYAKSLYVNQNSLLDLGAGDTTDHYSSSDYFNLLNNKKIKDLNFSEDISEDFKKDSSDYFKDAVAKLFGSENTLADSKTEIGENIYKDEVLNSKESVPSILSTINTYIPIILNGLSSPEQLNGLLATLYGFQGAIYDFKDTLEGAINSLTENDNKVLKDFENAFKYDANTEKTYVDAVRNSMVDFANSMNGLAGKESVSTFNDASKSIANLIKGLIDGKTSLKFEMSSIKYLPGIIKFVRVLLLYIDSYSEDQLTKSVIDKKDILANKTKSVGKNEFDSKKWVGLLKKMVDDKNGEGLIIFKNLLNILFLTHDTDKGESNNEVDIQGVENPKTKEKVEYSSDTEIYGRLIGDLGVVLLGNETIEFNAPLIGKIKLYVSNLLKSLINKGLGYSSGGTIFEIAIPLLPNFADNLPDLIKGLVNKITDNGKNNDEWKIFTKDFIGYLWNDPNKKLGVSILDIIQNTKITDIPSKLGSIFPISISNISEVKANGSFDSTKSYLLPYLGSKTIKEIVYDIDKHISPLDIAPIKFDTLSSLFNKLYSSDHNLKNASSNYKELLKGLGLNSDGSTVSGSPMEIFKSFLNENAKLLTGVINLLKDFVDEMQNSLNKISESYINLQKDINVSIKMESNTVFEYTTQYKDKAKNTFKIEIETINNKIHIKSIS
ncbi:hypothetical protein SLITO_v1c05210 [Spiroplasma litorale]|uniref:MOLPALP family lipoprotein n=1 Tax=Spiroplasma litorale TaxID=216942 RepID=A0A0K1W1G8_9MOLU|nr:lipoprotein [Spiroplasma litorale]AKX34169.1 hypothetical protein SLITO_v1c05210 [Spiroplasma litorale]